MGMGNTQVLELIGQAKTLYDEAATVYSNPAASAEAIAEAKKKRDSAASIQVQAKALMEILEEAGALPNLEEMKNGRSGGSSGPTSKSFKDFDEFVEALAIHALGGKRDERLKTFRDKDEDAAENGRKDLSGATGSAGGFLIPVENYPQLMAVAAPLAIIRPRATKIRMRRRQITIPMLDQTKVPTGFPSYFGGIQVYWAEEASEKPQSEPSFRNYTLTAHKLVGYTRASDELLDDVDTLSDFLGGPKGFPGAIAWAEDYAFLRGSGNGQPLGILNSAATIAVTRATTSKIEYADIAAIVGRFMGTAPVWIAHITVKEALLTMSGPKATNNNGFYMWGDAKSGVPDQLMGYPIFFTDKVPTLGNKGDLGLYDLSEYIIADRQATTFETSKQERFRFDQTSFRAVHRVDGAPWLNAPITLVDGETQVSPFVTVAA